MTHAKNNTREIFTSRVTFETKPQPGKSLPTLCGYAMTWGTLSDDRGGYKVRLKNGSAKAIPTGPTLALANHDYCTPLASNANGTLRMTADATGLRCEIDLPDTTWAHDLCATIDHLKNDTTSAMGMSFGMLPNGTYAEVKEAGQTIREYSAFEFDEVSTTVIPAFTSTTIDAADDEEEEEEAELTASESSDEEENELAAVPAAQPVEAVQPPTPNRNKLSVEIEELKAGLSNQ